MKRTPLRSRRPTPRRDEGRVQHGRIKERRVEPSADQERFHGWLKEQFPRCQCGCGRESGCTHHLLAQAPGKQGRRDHWFVVRLAHHCHNGGKESVHLLGSEAKFARVHGADLVAIAVANLAAWRSRQ